MRITKGFLDRLASYLEHRLDEQGNDVYHADILRYMNEFVVRELEQKVEDWKGSK